MFSDHYKESSVEILQTACPLYTPSPVAHELKKWDAKLLYDESLKAV